LGKIKQFNNGIPNERNGTANESYGAEISALWLFFLLQLKIKERGTTV